MAKTRIKRPAAITQRQAIVNKLKQPGHSAGYLKSVRKQLGRFDKRNAVNRRRTSLNLPGAPEPEADPYADIPEYKATPFDRVKAQGQAEAETAATYTTATAKNQKDYADALERIKKAWKTQGDTTRMDAVRRGVESGGGLTDVLSKYAVEEGQENTKASTVLNEENTAALNIRNQLIAQRIREMETGQQEADQAAYDRNVDRYGFIQDRETAAADRAAKAQEFAESQKQFNLGYKLDRGQYGLKKQEQRFNQRLALAELKASKSAGGGGGGRGGRGGSGGGGKGGSGGNGTMSGTMMDKIIAEGNKRDSVFLGNKIYGKKHTTKKGLDAAWKTYQRSPEFIRAPQANKNTIKQLYLNRRSSLRK